MKQKKLKLKTLKIDSFVTQEEVKNSETVKGGLTWRPTYDERCSYMSVRGTCTCIAI